MTINCTILLFAQIADAVGESELSLDLPDDATVNHALDALAMESAAISSHRATLAVAVNERYATPETALTDGDTIALIPPVSGG